jgi:hypothetical protein
MNNAGSVSHAQPGDEPVKANLAEAVHQVQHALIVQDEGDTASSHPLQ